MRTVASGSPYAPAGDVDNIESGLMQDEGTAVQMKPLIPLRTWTPLEEVLGQAPSYKRKGHPLPKRTRHIDSQLQQRYEKMKSAGAITKRVPRWEPPPELVFDAADIELLPLSILYDALSQLAEWGHLDAVYNLANGLLTIRGETPTYKIYHALILANASELGSADDIIHLMEELDEEEIELDQTLCNAILRVLAVHPDYILRTEILQHMERRWFSLSDTGHHMIVASMFRELQLERAVQELQTMKSNDLKIESWLYTLGIATLVQAGEFDEAMRMMRLRLEDLGNTHVTALWTYILDSAAEAHHYITCRYIWIRCVKADYINVSSGTCLHLMNLAARQGDVEFAQDIIRVIKRHHFVMTAHHWELLIEAQANAGEVQMALSTVVDMGLDRMYPVQGTTRPIYAALKAIPDDKRDDVCLELYEYLLNQHSLVGRRVPPQAVDVLLESCHYAQSAYDMYHNYRQVCRSGPTAVTFHHLFRFTMQEGDAKRALKLASEHKLMKLNPDEAIYDGLVMTLLQAKYNMDTIMDVYDDMRAMLERPMFRTMAAVYVALRICNDPRAPEIFAHLQQREGGINQGELSPELQKLRMNVASQIARDKEPSRSTDTGPVPYPPYVAGNLQRHVEEVQESLKNEL